MRIDFESKPTYGYDDKYIKTKLKTYKDSIITNFHNFFFKFENYIDKKLDVDSGHNFNNKSLVVYVIHALLGFYFC